MKVVCDRTALLEALTLVSGVVVSRTPKPALLCVKVTAAGDTLTLWATDQEVAIRLSTSRVEVQTEGEALIPADKFSQIVRESIDPTLTLTTEKNEAHITGQDSRFKIFGQPVEDFPAIPQPADEPDFEIPAAELHRLIALTIFATARENSRYAINGVLMDRKKNKLTVVATDGHRLALAKGSCKSTQAEDRSAIIPTKALHLLLRLFEDAQQDVRVKIDKGQVYFATDQAVLSCNLMEGNFPPYDDVIPKDGDKKATIARDLLTSAVRRAALLTNEESKGVRMAFTGGKLVMTSRAAEMGEAEINVDVAEYTGDDVEIGFNPTYILDALKVITDKEVHMDFKASNKPGILRAGADFLYVVMPVNLQ